jgi:membrane fusion protein (multidrug efflux system)
LAAVCTACNREPPAAKPAAAAPQAVPATVVTVQPQRLPIVLQAVGTTEGSREIEVRSRVSGILEKRLYQEGAPIAAGEPMFRIERAPFEIALGQARAQVAEAEARLAQARRDEERFRPLVSQGFVSRKAYDDARSAVEFAAAQIKQAQAVVREAELNLSYTLVTAPLRGIAGRALRSEGALISTTAEGSLLTTIAQIDPIWVRFSLSQSDVDRLPGARLPALQGAEVRLVRQDGRPYPHAGTVNFAASEIDPRLATQQLRAEFPNPEEVLLPGEFVRVELAAGELQDVFLVPQNAVVQTEKGEFVFVLDAAGRAAMRPVETGAWRGTDWIIRKGLAPGDRVVVDNLLKIRPGVPVQGVAPQDDAPVARAAAPAPR